eukprot:2876730-Amphidinium_carterae.1
MGNFRVVWLAVLKVETDSSINDTDTLQQSMAAIGETNSTVSSMFSTSLVANLEVHKNCLRSPKST